MEVGRESILDSRLSKVWRCMTLHPKISFFVMYVIAFSIVFVASFIGFYWTSKSFLRSYDGLDQHYLYFVYMGEWLRSVIADSIAAGHLVVPMWNTGIGLGGDVITTMGAYLGDPFNWVSVFIAPQHAEAAFNVMIVARFFFAGLAFAWYGFNHGDSRFAVLCGAVSYAFSGYMLVTFIESFFATPMVLFPLLLLGADRLFQGRSPVLFIVAAALFFIDYFYFAYMACLFLVPYCICCYLRYAPLRSAGSFILWVLKVLGCLTLGALISCVILLPIVSVMMGAGRLDLERFVPLFYDLPYYATFIGGFVSHGYMGPDSWMGCGAVALLAVVLLFAHEGNGYVKAAFIGLTICVLLPIAGHVLNGFGYVTNRWMWVYALCVSFIIMRMVPYALHPDIRDMKAYVIVVAIMAAVLSLLPNAWNEEVSLCFVAAAILGAILLLWSINSDGVRLRMREGVLLAFAAISVVIPAAFVYAPSSGVLSEEMRRGVAYESVFNGVVPQMVSAVDDDALWRYDLAEVGRVRNSSQVTGLNGFDFYISIYNGSVDELLSQLEVPTTQFNMQIRDLDRRSWLEAAFCAKYFLIPAGDERFLPYGCSDEPVVTRKIGNAEYSVYENELALPLAYAYDAVISRESYDELTAAQKQEALLQACVLEGIGQDAMALSYSSEVLSTAVLSVSGGSFNEEGAFVADERDASVTVECKGVTEGELYVDLLDLQYEGVPPQMPTSRSPIPWREWLLACYAYSEPTAYSVNIEASDGSSAQLDALTYKHHMYGGKDSNLMNLGYSASRPDVMEVTISFSEPGIYRFDSINVVNQPVERLPGLVAARAADGVQVTESVNSYTATLDAASDSKLLFTVPFSSGWSAFVDGTEVPCSKANVAFTVVDVPEGAHTVELRYETPFLRLGAALSSVGLCALLAIILHAAIKRRGRDVR